MAQKLFNLLHNIFGAILPSSRFLRVIATVDLTAVKLVLIPSSILWALLLLWPGLTFDRPTYSIMRELFNENIWGFLFGIHGWILAHFVYDTNTKWRTVYYLNNFLGCLLWSSSSLMMLFSVYPPPAAISGELVLSLASIWLFLRTDSKAQLRRVCHSKIL